MIRGKVTVKDLIDEGEMAFVTIGNEHHRFIKSNDAWMLYKGPCTEAVVRGGIVPPLNEYKSVSDIHSKLNEYLKKDLEIYCYIKGVDHTLLLVP